MSAASRRGHAELAARRGRLLELRRDRVCFVRHTEQSLAQRIKAFGIDAPDTIKQWKKLNTEYNVAAMKLLQSDDFETVGAPEAKCAAITLSRRAPLSY